MKPFVSIIVPVYNVEQYLDRCIQSIFMQTQKQIELILVDDGSTDQSGILCDELKKQGMKYEMKVQVLHKENGGLTSAWKAGVLIATGEFVGFVDSDDWIEPKMYETLYQKAITTGADMVCCGIKHVFEDKDHKEWDDQMLVEKELYTKEEMYHELYAKLINNGSFMGRTLQPNRVSKLVKRELILKNMELCNNAVTVGEDYQFSFSLLLSADKIAVVKNYVPYYYWVNKKSMTGQFDEAYLDKIKLMKEQMLKIGKIKNQFNFESQIRDDFLCLTILHLKDAIIKNKDGFQKTKHRLQSICEDSQVKEALMQHKMDKLTMAEQLFILFMKKKSYRFMYLVIKVYFRT